MRPAIAMLALTAALGAAGCGVGAGEAPEDVSLRISEGFGTRPIAHEPRPDVSGEDTVMRMLERNADVETAYGGRFVSGIDGRAGGERVDGSTNNWMYFVDGVLAKRGAAAVRLRDGDRVWWDRQNTRLLLVRAVVGSFPAPLDDGAADVACAEVAAASCRAAVRRLRAAGVRPVVRALRDPARPSRVRVVVGAWPRLRDDRAAAPFAKGPKASGVLAVPAGQDLVPYDTRGRAGQRVRDWGLVAALHPAGSPVTWLVTGAGERDAARAAAALREPDLRGRFAVLVRAGSTVALPTRPDA